MKKTLPLIAVFFLTIVYPLQSQSILNRVKNAAANKILGKSEENAGNPSKPGPEPDCAREDAMQIIDLNQFKVDYNEITICVKEDGTIIVRNRLTGKYYAVKDKKTEGPLDENDPRITECNAVENTASGNNSSDVWAARFSNYITRSGEKYLINFNGKSYGEFAVINDFAISQSGDNFAALVIEEVMVTDDLNKKMEAEVAKAKTDQERMEIAMKYGQQISERMMQTNTESTQLKIVSNVAGAKYDPLVWMGGSLNGKVKFDDIVVLCPDKILDLQGKTLINLSANTQNYKELFLNTSNTKYATYNYGTLSFSDNSTLSELFNPALVKSSGKVNLTYMYYSPGKNAIMLAAIPF